MHRLNAEQQQIVSNVGKKLCVLAGAGSGKTTVLTHRLAHLIQKNYIKEQSFLLLTFSNKAVCSLRQKLNQLHISSPNYAVSTFHAFAFFLLKKYGHLLNLPTELHIIGSAQQKRILITGFLKQGIKPNPSAIDQCIRRLRENQRLDQMTPIEAFVLSYYRSHLAQQGCLDFDGLISQANFLIKTQAALLERLHAKIQALFVDEFQDTNAAQYEMITRLITPETYLFLVGDDDQAIYGWRGAHQAQFEQFLKQYPEAVLLKLERNYRSHPKILAIANRLINHNIHRVHKALQPTIKDTEKGRVTLTSTLDEVAEAEYIVSELTQLLQAGMHPRECLVLYRTHQVAQLLEARLITAGLDYQMARRRTVLEHSTVKRLVQYLRCLINPNLDVAFRELLLQEVKGIGARRLEQLEKHAMTSQLSLWSATLDLLSKNSFSPLVVQTLLRFLQQLDALGQEIAQLDLIGSLLHCIKIMKLDPKQEALEALLLAAEHFQTIPMFAGISDYKQLIAAFLNHVSLEEGTLETDEAEKPCIQLMTLHRAKGLEFSYVFIMAIEEGILPLHRTDHDRNPVNLEEERRLLYMGMTRAKTQLFLSYAIQRKNSFSSRGPSRFLSEIGQEEMVVQAYRAGSSPLLTGSASKGTPAFNYAHLAGTWVEHSCYGKGIVIRYKQMGARCLIGVEFEDSKQLKWFSQNSELFQQLIRERLTNPS